MAAVTETGDVVSVWIQESSKVLRNLAVPFAYILTQTPNKKGKKKKGDSVETKKTTVVKR